MSLAKGTGTTLLLTGLTALLVLAYLAAFYVYLDMGENGPTDESALSGENPPVNEGSAATDNMLPGENTQASENAPTNGTSAAYENGASENMWSCENEQVPENEMTSENTATGPTLAELRIVLENIEIPEELNFDIYHFINTWENTVNFLEMNGIPYHVGEELAGNGKPMLYSDNWYWTIYNPKGPGGWYTVQETFVGQKIALYLQRQLDEAGFRAGFAGLYFENGPTDPQALVAVETADHGVVLVDPSVNPEYRYVYTRLGVGDKYLSSWISRVHIWWSDGEGEIWK